MFALSKTSLLDDGDCWDLALSVAVTLAVSDTSGKSNSTSESNSTDRELESVHTAVTEVVPMHYASTTTTNSNETDSTRSWVNTTGSAESESTPPPPTVADSNASWATTARFGSSAFSETTFHTTAANWTPIFKPPLQAGKSLSSIRLTVNSLPFLRQR